jgi:hypothetical protein
MNKSNGMEDNQLVRECLQGETEEFKKIVEKYRGGKIQRKDHGFSFEHPRKQGRC